VSTAGALDDEVGGGGKLAHGQQGAEESKEELVHRGRLTPPIADCQISIGAV